MPQNTRQWALQEIERAKGNLDWVVKHLYPVVQRYGDEGYSEQAAPLLVMCETVVELQAHLDKIKESF